MKSLPCFLLLLVFSVLFFSCDDKDPEPEKFFTVMKDNALWADEPNIFLYQDSLIVVAGDMNRHLSLKVKFTGVGEFGPPAFRATYHDVVGGDAYVSEYTAAEDPGATFTITEYNPETKAIKGVFHFNARKKLGGASYKETLVFSRGAFKGTVLSRNWF